MMVELQLALFWPLTTICVAQAIRLWMISRENKRRGKEAVRMQQETQFSNAPYIQEFNQTNWVYWQAVNEPQTWQGQQKINTQ